MKINSPQIHGYHFSARLLEWGKLISIMGSSQILIQGIGFISGIIIIRSLPTQEYGIYTLANTMLGTMMVLADAGISSSVMAQGGKVWQSRERLGAVLVTGFDLRKKFAIGSLFIALPFLFYLLRRHNADWLACILIVSSLLPTFFIALSCNLLTVGPALHQKVVRLQKTHLGVSIGRLIMLASTIFIFPFPFVAILSSGIPQLFGNHRLQQLSGEFADWNQASSDVIKKDILAFVKRTFPGAVYYCLSGQITIWLISIFGTTASIAQVGALARFSVILNVFSSTFGILVVPRFARLSANKILLYNRFIKILLGLLLLSLLFISIISLLPSQFLWILGSKYSSLQNELVLSIAGSCTSLIAGLLFTIANSRGWAINPFISIPLRLTAVACGVFLIDISTIAGVLVFNLFISGIEVIIYVTFCVMRIANVR